MVGNTSSKHLKQAVIEEKLANITEPLIGLQYVVEVHKEGCNIEPRYVCELCNSKCDCKTLMAHVVGAKHRLLYLKEHHTNYHSMILEAGGPKREQSLLAAEYAHVVQTKEGRRKVRCKIDLDPFYALQLPQANSTNSPDVHDEGGKKIQRTHWDGQDQREKKWSGSRRPYEDAYFKKCGREPNAGIYDSTCQVNEGQIQAEGYDTGSIYHGGAVSGNLRDNHIVDKQMNLQGSISASRPPPLASTSGISRAAAPSQETSTSPAVATSERSTSSEVGAISKADMFAMLNSLSKCLVSNEDEAAMALQVSNALTQALLKYRLENVS